MTGGAGKVRLDPPKDTAEARTVSWAAACHFLLVEIGPDEARVTPIGGDGSPLALRSPSGGAVPPTTVIRT